MSALMLPACAAAALLLLGWAMVRRVAVLRACFIPPSVAGGLVGLGLIQATGAAPRLAPLGAELAASLRGWPAPLLALVFAGLLLERPRRGLRQSARGAALAAITVWVIVLGQIAIGLAATGLIIRPALHEVPAAFGQILEAGFAGGHGTAAAMGTIFRDVLGFPAGADLALFVATVGLVYSVVSGIVLVNLGVRRGWSRLAPADLARASAATVLPAVRRGDSAAVAAPIRAGRVALQALLLALAVLLGWGLQRGFVASAGAGGDATAHLRNVPLFLFTLIGGWLLRHALTRAGAAGLIDTAIVKRLVGAAMEILIVAAVASLRLETLVSYAWPIALLVGLGCIWVVVCLIWLSPRLLPRGHWFELGLINYGMSTGTTAQGMMLLRLVDPGLESDAAEEYALAAPFSAPFIGGGIVTLSLPLSLERVGIGPVVVAILVALTGLYLLGRWLRDAAP
jgi:ESS family glutamate:Na+ symporter